MTIDDGKNIRDSTDTDVISFKGRAMVNQTKPRNDLLVIELTIKNIDVARVIIHTGSSAKIIFKNTLERMKIDPYEIAENPSPLVGLSRETTMALGSINLTVKAGTIEKIAEFLAIPSTYHLCLKFSTPRGIETIWGNPRVAQVCFAAELKRKQSDSETTPRKKLASEKKSQERDSEELFWQLRKAEILEGKREPTCEPVVSVCLEEAFPERCIEIGANLHEPIRTNLITCLKNNLHAFAWATEDMPGIDINITSHELNIDPTFKPVKQKRRKLGPERATAVNDEVEKLLKVGSITEVRYPDWLAHPVVVKKKNGMWRVMPFGFKNAGATYQRLVNRMFFEQLGKTMEVYIDDMLVKSLHAEDHVSYLEECFTRLNLHNMKLNPAKCRFAVASEEFLGYLVTYRYRS
ncbi:uncharacterized protein LOC125585927 [Brassica napus]|uniref:uncharacterized protein LOC125585927 n=1 Tax=Brassica napus TaxID=3708 RepID=UPI00207ACCC7|nr:uncharacterized protein LOC125585927 [Brassica napus]